MSFNFPDSSCLSYFFVLIRFSSTILAPLVFLTISEHTYTPFRDEFLGRINEMVVFHPFSEVVRVVRVVWIVEATGLVWLAGY